MNFLKNSVFCIILLQTYTGYAQVLMDTLKQLPTVEVSSPRLTNFSTGTKIKTIDSATFNQENAVNSKGR